MKILIAEDEAITRLLLSGLLQNLGHEVVVAKNGQQAWEAFTREYFPVVISDWIMPELDGLDLCRMIRAEQAEKYTYIILVTALSGKKNYLEGMDAGADDFVTKPFDPDELTARLRVAERILQLQEHVKRLEGLLPTCMYCKKVRDRDDVWTPLEEYIIARTDAAFSHGICPECYVTRARPALEPFKREGS